MYHRWKPCSLDPLAGWLSRWSVPRKGYHLRALMPLCMRGCSRLQSWGGKVDSDWTDRHWLPHVREDLLMPSCNSWGC
jgi:hypothetical protein